MKMRFSKIISLFEMHDEYEWNYTHHIADEFHNHTQFTMDILSRGIRQAVGKRSDFHTWISLELEKFFMEFMRHFSTGDVILDASRKKMHQHISKKCKNKKFKRDLSIHILNELNKYFPPNTNFDQGRYVVLKFITEYIYNLYNIENQ